MTKASEIIKLITHNRFTNAELNEITEALRYSRADLTRQVKRNLQVGDTVNFDSAKLGRNVTGVVMKVAIKFVTVKTLTLGQWRVPANMLTKIEDKEYA
jgi:hypothetical protein